MGHVVRQQVGHGQTGAVRALTQRDGLETKLPELRDVLEERRFVVAPG